MAQTSFPFENIDTTETQFSQWARNINEGIKQGNGDELAVSADGTGMAVTVGAGQAMIRGHYYTNTDDVVLTITASDPTNARIDAVVLELDPGANAVTLKVLAGTPAGSPVAPTITQTDTGIYQLLLAYVDVEAATLGIDLVDLTDKRGFMFAGVGKWTTDNRPTDPVAYETLGYNTTLNAHEFWNGTSWVGFADPITTLGDLIVGGASGVPERLPVGTDDQVLTVVSGEPTWADPSGAGGTYYKSSTAQTISVSFPAGLYSITYSGAGSVTVEGQTYSAGSAMYEFESGISSITFPAQLGASWAGLATSDNYFGWQLAASSTRFLGGKGLTTIGWSDDNGTTWNPVTMPANVRGFASDGTDFVAAGNGYVAHSTDGGETWSANKHLGIPENWNWVVYLNGRYIAISATGRYIQHSTDGVTWTLVDRGGAYFGGWNMAFDGTNYFSFVRNNDALSTILYSTNLTTWSEKASTDLYNNFYGAAAYFNGYYIGITTDNRVVWTDTLSGSGLSSAAAIEGWQIVEVGGALYATNNGDSSIRKSTNGLSWGTYATFMDGQARGLAANPTAIMGGSTVNVIARSLALPMYLAVEEKAPLTEV